MESRMRLATADDEQTILDITNAAYEHYVPLLGRKPQPMEVDYLPKIEAGEVWLLDLEGQLVGMIVVVDEVDCLLIYSVAVRPQFQKRGLGRRLLAWAEARAAQAGYSRTRLYTYGRMVENIALYGRVGYVETGRKAYAGGEIVYMDKRLEG